MTISGRNRIERVWFFDFAIGQQNLFVVNLSVIFAKFHGFCDVISNFEFDFAAIG